MTVKGEVYSREELYVDGEIEGSIEMQHRLTVGPNGKVRATIKAREVVVHGNVQGDVEVSDLCRREGLNPVQFYAWKKQLLGAAARIFEDQRGRPDAVRQRLEAENARFKGVIGEITAENLELKKGLSG